MKAKWAYIKQKCIRQSTIFIELDRNKRYGLFHSSHYDWWAFPIDKLSSKGQKYMVTSQEKTKLIKDEQFMQALRTNAILVSRSWGYDLQKGIDIISKMKEQSWHKWPIRLYKMSNSLQLFEQWHLHRNSIKYGMELINRGENFSYFNENLDRYYKEWEHRNASL